MAKTSSKSQIIREIEAIMNKGVEMGLFSKSSVPSHYKLQKMSQEELEDQLRHSQNVFADFAYRAVDGLGGLDFGKLAGLINTEDIIQNRSDFEQKHEANTKALDKTIATASEAFKQMILQSVELPMSEVGLTDEDITVDVDCMYNYAIMRVSISNYYSFYSITSTGKTDISINQCFEPDSQEYKEAIVMMAIVTQMVNQNADIIAALQECYTTCKDLNNNYDVIFKEENEYAHKAFETYLNALCVLTSKK